MAKEKLKRSLGLGALLFYGIGDILGAGIYALVGKVAEQSGSFVWLSFLAAFAVASLTGLSYAELATRFPKSAGSSHYVAQAFKSRLLPLLLGCFVACACVVSLSAAARAFAGYAAKIVDVPEWAVIVFFLAVLSGINFKGIKDSSSANIICTSIESTGLLLIIGFGLTYILGGADVVSSAPSSTSISGQGFGVLVGASLAFYAFMGFEDLANVAEECIRPKRDLPIAIIGSLIVAGLVYLLVSWIATQVMSPSDLANSKAPLADVAHKIGAPIPNAAFIYISLFAVANTALLNAVTGSRLLFGMAEQKLLPTLLSRAHHRTKTPHYAILVIFFVALVLSLTGSIEVLAGATSLLLLITFSMVHATVLRLPRDKKSGFSIPRFIPVIGIFTTISLVALLPWRQQLLGFAAAAIAGLVVIIYEKKSRNP